MSILVKSSLLAWLESRATRWNAYVESPEIGVATHLAQSSMTLGMEPLKLSEREKDNSPRRDEFIDEINVYILCDNEIDNYLRNEENLTL